MNAHSNRHTGGQKVKVQRFILGSNAQNSFVRPAAVVTVACVSLRFSFSRRRPLDNPRPSGLEGSLEVIVLA